MPVIVTPRYMTLDTSSLINLSEDYWSKNHIRFSKAKGFVKQLKDECLYITLTTQHIYELLQHENPELANSRITFLKQLPMVAWVRPFDNQWFIGGFLDIMSREIDEFLKDKSLNWNGIVSHVRETLWQTGTGDDMFGDHNREIWDLVRESAVLQQKRNVEVASILRVKHEVVQGRKLSECETGDVKKMNYISKRTDQIRREMLRELEDHGDKRLQNMETIAKKFSDDTQARVLECAAQNQNLVSSLLEEYNIPERAITKNMTVTEFGILASYAAQLSLVSERVSQTPLTVLDVPIDTSPSNKLKLLLEEIQNCADRVSGSDIGDSHIASCLFYSDYVQVDKRTNHYLNMITKKNPAIRSLLNCYFKESDYGLIPQNVLFV